MKTNFQLHQEDFQKRTRRFSEKSLLISGRQQQPPNKLSGGCDNTTESSH